MPCSGSPCWLSPLPAVAADGPDPLPRRGAFGVKVGPVEPDAAAKAKLEAGAGVQVIEALPGSAAEAAGLKAGDV
ncbi:MAG: hypothetical protein K2X91_13555, partial [Thermoleophilia bacterium]|nr:hypothetical protein [Thermoleophilia bacterium]